MGGPGPENLTGKAFGGLKALEYVGPCKSSDLCKSTGAVWKCECLLCGQTVNVPARSLKKGNTKSCGCGEAQNRSKIKQRTEPYRYDGTIISFIKPREKPRKSNTTGATGVYWRKDSGKWFALVTLRGKSHRKSYNTFEEAVEGRKLLEEKYFAPVIQEYEDQKKRD